MKKFLIIFCVFVVLFAFITEPARVEASASLALLLGGTSAAKAFLAFIMSCVAMGVTYSTYDSAKSAYDDYLENASVSIEDIRYVQQEAWTGNYEAVANELTDIHSGIKSWLQGLFGSLVVGDNTIGGDYYINGYNISIQYHEDYSKSIALYVNNQLYTRYLSNNQDKRNILITGLNYNISKLIINVSYEYKNSLGNWISSSTTMEPSYTSLTSNGITQTTQQETTTITITADAPILNPSYSPQNRTFPPAPYLPYINPGNEKVSESISATGGTMEVYNGTYDQYLDDVVENAMWEDIQGVISGSVPTTTLTETSEGLIIGESTVGIPYPIPNESAPTDVLEGIGSITGILQSIINWFHQLIEFLKSLFMIPEGFMVGIMDDLKNDISGKFDNSLWIGHIQSFGTIEAEGIPDLEFRGEIILESDYVNNIAPTVKAWVSGGMIILIALYNLNQVYKLVRGSDYVGDRGRSKA